MDMGVRHIDMGTSTKMMDSCNIGVIVSLQFGAFFSTLLSSAGFHLSYDDCSNAFVAS